MIKEHNGIKYLAQIVLHEDDLDLQPIYIDLPTPPKRHLIDGHDLPDVMQMFEHQEMPKKLLQLQTQKNAAGTPLSLEEMHSHIKNNPGYYTDEIKWIKKQWRRRLYGYWFFCNGVATFMDGWHYFYINFWPNDNKKRKDKRPDYRNRDLKWFHGTRLCYLDPNCYGPLYGKHRREGATFRAQCVGYCICTENEDAWGALQSMTEDHAKKAFQSKLIGPWKKLPFFFKPLFDGSSDPKTTLNFEPQSAKVRGGSIGYNDKKGLGGRIYYAVSAEGALDGDKYMFIHHDEIGKKDKDNVDYVKRYQIIKPTLAQPGGGGIHGLYIGTSTVGDQTAQGGKDFARLAELSYHHQINETSGQTASGLWNMFISAYEGYEGFIDQYGNSVIEDPEEPIYNEFGKVITIGSKTYIESIKTHLRTKEAWKELNEFTRQNPTRFRDCFRKSDDSSGFNLQKINDFMDIYRRHKQTRRGRFQWENDVRFSRVEWVDDPENGKWVVSSLLDVHSRNKVYWDNDSNGWVFQNPGLKYCGGDTVKFPAGRVKGKRKSKGAFAIFYAHDELKDSFDIDKKYWKSDQFVCTYKNEVYDINEYNEHMLMTCWFYGALLYPELNIYNSVQYFDDNNCTQLMLFDIDDRMRIEANPGAVMNTATKQEIFKLWMMYVEHGLTKEKHGELVEEVSAIDGPEDVTNHDLFAAGGLALKASKNRYIRMQQEQESDTDLGGRPWLNYEEV